MEGTAPAGADLFGDEASATYFRPLLLWTLAGTPVVDHGVNLLLHAALVLVAWRILLLLLPWKGAALAGALIFAVHPVHVEGVAWVSGRGDLLAPLLGMLGWLVLARRTDPGGWSMLGAACLFVAALAGKETAVAVLLMALVAAAVTRPSRGQVRALLQATGLALTVWMVWRGLAVGFEFPEVDARENPAAGLPFGRRLATAAGGLTLGLRLLCWPHPLRLDYSVPVTADLPAGSLAGLLAMGLTGLVVAAAAILLRRDASLLQRTGLGIALLLAAWLPVSSLLRPVGSLVAERYLILPSFGFALAAASLGAHLLASRDRRGGSRRFPPAALVTLAVVLSLATVSAARVPHWRDDTSLLAADLRRAQASFKVHYMAAWLHLGNAEDQKALQEFEACLAAAPGFSRCREGRARALRVAGRLDEARAEMDQALRAAPPQDHLRARYHLLRGEIRRAQGQTSAAEDDLRQATRLDPRSASAARALGDLLFGAGRRGEAARAYAEAVRRRPDDAVALFNLALTRALQEERSEAEALFSRVLVLPGAPPETRFHLGVLAELRGDAQAALEHFRAFADTPGGDESMRSDARRRLARLEISTSGARAPAPR